MAGMKAGPKAPVSVSSLPELVGRTPADRVAYFFREHLQHVKGEWAGQAIELAPWQRDKLIKPLFNTLLKPSKLRQYRTCYVEVPRKNGKSSLAAGLALYALYYDQEPGAEVVAAAADRTQAAIVFDIARRMVETSPALLARTQIYRRELYVPGTESTFKVISSEAYSKHGMNLSAAIVDELHAHENRELLDVLMSSMGSRRQPFTFIITTAGFDKHSVCWEFHQHAEKVLEAPDLDPTFLPVLYGATLEDDWTDPAVWRRVNPGYGVSIKPEFLAQECKRAKEMPAYENAFKRLYLDIWTESETRWLSMEQWDRGNVPVDEEALTGKRCVVGVDLSSNLDLSAAVALFPRDGGYDVLLKAWLPKENLQERVRRDKVPFEVWARQKHLTLTEGNVIDQDAIEALIREWGGKYRVEAIQIDPWNASRLLARLQADGLPAAPQPQTMGALTAATKALEAAVLKGQLRHGGNPIFRWAAANVVVEQDHNENVKPSKLKSTERIDPIAALVNALARELIIQATKPSVYEERGVLSVSRGR